VSEDLTGSFQVPEFQVHRFQVPKFRSTGFRFQSSGPKVSEDTTASRVYRFRQQDSRKILICIMDDTGTSKNHGMEVRRINFFSYLGGYWHSYSD
jgi:hypothetical protein